VPGGELGQIPRKRLIEAVVVLAPLALDALSVNLIDSLAPPASACRAPAGSFSVNTRVTPCLTLARTTRRLNVLRFFPSVSVSLPLSLTLAFWLHLTFSNMVPTFAVVPLRALSRTLLDSGLSVHFGRGDGELFAVNVAVTL
jgi:hypothetical protein